MTVNPTLLKVVAFTAGRLKLRILGFENMFPSPENPMKLSTHLTVRH